MNKGPIIRRDGGPEKSSIPTLVCSPYVLEHIFTAYDFCFVIQMWEIAVGLQYLHSQGVIHADLRGVKLSIPSNIFQLERLYRLISSSMTIIMSVLQILV
jgi:hypothetical protein